MWQRFSERARKSVYHAQEAAQSIGELYVSPEHLLLGLLAERNTATEVLSEFGLGAEAVRVAVLDRIRQGDPIPTQDMTLTPRSKRVIDLAYENARILGDNHIGTEHLLLGLIHEADGVAGRVLADLGVQLQVAREAVVAAQKKDRSSLDIPKHAELRPFLFLNGQCLRTHLLLTMIGNPADRAGQVIAAQCQDIGGLQWQLWSEIVAASKSATNRIDEDLLDRLLRHAHEAAGGDFMGSEHLLLALFAEGDTVFRQLLSRFGITEEKTRELIVRASG